MLRRHDLLRIRPDGWARVLAGSFCVQRLADEPSRLVGGWAERGWPVIVRRRTAEENGAGIAVGLPLPPAYGKLRLAFFVPPELVAETVAAVSLREEQVSTPASWQPQVVALTALGERLALPPSIYGALLWQHLTGLPYLHDASDIDLIWPTPSAGVLPRLLDGLARVDGAGPVRVDGEITLASGCGVNWRELQQELPAPGGSVLVKSMNGADIRCAQNSLRVRTAPQPTGVGREPALPTVDLPVAVAERVGALAAAALTAELETWPKPGLVSPVDRGSHDDMDETTFRRSIAALRPFYVRLAAAGAAGTDMERLRQIGRDAESAMLAATHGANTHRGAIFGLGLLCAAAGAAWMTQPFRSERSLRTSAADLSDIVRLRWGSAIRRGPIPLRSHGSDALRQFCAGGARAEAATGFPHALQVGLPTLRCGRAFARGEAAARVHTFFSLLAQVEDTNLLHRGGADGLRDAQCAACRFLSAGGVGQAEWRAQAVAIHRAFVARRLSPGGSADLLAATIFLDRIDRDG